MDTNLDKHIEFRPKRDGQMRPFIAGTRVEVAYIVTDSEEHDMSAEEIALAYDHLSLAQVHAALAYFHDNRDDVRRMIREDDEMVKKFQEQLTTSSKTEGGTDAASPLSS